VDANVEADAKGVVPAGVVAAVGASSVASPSTKGLVVEEVDMCAKWIEEEEGTTRREETT
jgi:pyruvoyl-dependent arginine decarboxylase (PvlArgDC)